MKSYLEIILDCFSKMDIQGLRLFLKKEYTYQEANQNIFLDKIDAIFNDLKESGDTELIIYKGYCMEISCNPDLIRTGYRFVGNNSGDYLSLRFVTDTENGLDVTDILDIFSCGCLSVQEPMLRIGVRKIVDISFFERAGFKWPIEVLMHNDLAKIGVSKLTKNSELGIQFSDIESWLLEFQNSMDFFKENIRKFYEESWIDFMDLYNELNELVYSIRKMEQMELLDISDLTLEKDEKIAIQWILRMEEILLDEGNDLNENLTKNKDGFFLLFRDEFMIYGELINKFGDAILQKFNPIRNRLIEKYFAFTQQDIDQMSEEYPFLDESCIFFPLSKHLKVREEASKKGEQIPLYLQSINK